MSEVTLISTQERPLRPLVEAALANQLRLLEAGVRRTEQSGSVRKERVAGDFGVRRVDR
jgi:hypothetical protein